MSSRSKIGQDEKQKAPGNAGNSGFAPSPYPLQKIAP